LPPQTLKPDYGPGGNWPRPVTWISQLGSPKTTRVGTFFKHNIGCVQQPGVKHEMGDHRFKWGAGHRFLLATAL